MGLESLMVRYEKSRVTRTIFINAPISLLPPPSHPIPYPISFIYYLFVISRALQGHSADVRYNYVTKYLQ